MLARALGAGLATARAGPCPVSGRPWLGGRALSGRTALEIRSDLIISPPPGCHGSPHTLRTHIAYTHTHRCTQYGHSMAHHTRTFSFAKKEPHYMSVPARAVHHRFTLPRASKSTTTCAPKRNVRTPRVDPHLCRTHARKPAVACTGFASFVTFTETQDARVHAAAMCRPFPLCNLEDSAADNLMKSGIVGL